MKITVASMLLLAMPLLASAGSEAGHHHSSDALLRYKRASSHKRHASAWASSSRSAMLKKRKTPGNGDSTTAPANIAKGTAKAPDCAIWHTVAPGEVCLGVIDKSPGFTLEHFLKLNPSVDKDCTNLIVGQAYCVDVTTTGGSKETPARPAAAPAADAPEEEEDCEEEDEPEEEDCEEEDEPVVKVAPKAAPQVKAAPKKNTPPPPPPPAPKVVEPKPEVVQVKPQPKPQPKPEVKKPEPQQGGLFQYISQPATYYYQNGVAGNCGKAWPDSKLMVALKTNIYAGGSHCGKTVTLKNSVTGKTVDAVVTDSCPSCLEDGIDLSEALFLALSPEGLGPGVLRVDYRIN